MRRIVEFLFLLALLYSAPTACSRVSDASGTATAVLVPSPTKSGEQELAEAEILAATLEAHRSGPWPTAPSSPPASTATPIPSGVSIEGERGVDGGLLPTHPLVVVFAEPMQSHLPRPAVTIFPYTEGSLEWNETGDRLTFTPKVGFTPGGSYVVAIDPELRTRRGELHEGPGHLSFRVAAPPRVIRHSPTQPVLADRKPVIELQFDRPMDQASVAQALSILPKAEFELSWMSADTVQIRVRELLQIGVGYRLALGEGARDEQGVPTGKAVFWEYGLPPIQVTVTGPSEEARTRPITLGFGYALDPESVMAALTITPSIAGTWTWSDAGSRATLELTQPLAPDTTYTFAFKAPLESPGGESFPAPAPVSFHSPSAILTVWPLEYWDEQAEAIAIEFDREMNHQATESAWKIDPPLEGRFEWQGNYLLFYPDSLPASGVAYTVSVGPSAVDAAGKRVLNSEYSWSFRTYDAGRLVRFSDWGEKIQVLDADGGRAIQFGLGTRTPTLVQFELSSLTIAQLVELAREDPSFRLPNAAMLDEPPEPVRVWDAVFSASGTILKAPIPDDVPAGLYLVTARSDGRVQDQMVIVLTRHVLALRKAGNQLLAWVTEINGDAVPGIEVRVYGSRGSKIRQSQADEDGLYKTTLAAGEEPLLVAARTADGDVTVSGVGNTWSSGYDYDWWGWGWSERNATPPKPLLAYVYTDRPIYRPGQTVHFKAIVRHDDDGVYRLPSTGTPVEVRIRDARDNVLQTSQHATHAFGSLDGDFQLAEKASLGDYTIEVSVQGQSLQGRFKVQDYRKPDLELTLQSDAKAYVHGETIRLDVDSRYFFDKPVSGASLVVRTYELGEFYGWWWEEPEQDDDEPRYVWYPSYGTEIKARTDAAGHFTTHLQAELASEERRNSDWRSSLEYSLLGIEATVDDGSHQKISTFTVVRIYNSREKLTLQTGSYLQPAGKAFNIDLGVTTISEEPVEGLKLGLQLFQWKRASHDYEEVGQRFEVVTDLEGRARRSLELETPGSYRLLATGTDSRGNPITFTRYLYAYAENDSWYRNAFEGRQEGISVAADRDLYEPYQTAELTIESALDGPALLTVERGQIRRERMIELTAPVTRIEIPILPADVPNIFVSVNAWERQSLTFEAEDFLTKAESRLRRATVELQVDATTKNLNLTITPERETFRPGEEAAVALAVTDHNGVPVSAEISLAVVDEAIFTLSEDPARPIREAFYGRRRHTVRGYDSMAPTRVIWEPGRGGGGGDGGLSPGNPRSDFQDTAAWFPHLFTDSAGRAAVTFDLPDDLTTWRLVAKAVTADTLVGEATASLVTQKEIVVRPLLPRSLTAGDEVDLPAVIHNYSEEPLAIDASLESEALELTSPQKVSLTVGADESMLVTWRATALREGQAEILVTANADNIGDAVRLSVPVRPLAVKEATAEAGMTEDEWSTVLVLPEGALDLSSVTIELNRSVAGGLFSGLEFLTGFPYGCVEQIMSKALPNAVVARAVRELGITYPGASEDLSDKIGKGLQMLYAMQHADGGWGWWYDDKSHDYQTAWVVFGLAKTAEAGYEVDEAVIDRGVEWLEKNLASMDPRTQAFALYSMAEAGHGNLDAIRTLRAREFELDGFSRAALALALDELGAEQEARSAVSALELYRVDGGQGAYWPTSEVDGYYNQKTMASSIRTTALVLSAMARVSSEDPAASEIARWLMGRRQDHGWGTTNETSFAVLALTDFLLYTQEAEAETGFMVELNGEMQAEGTLSDEQPRFTLTIPAPSMVRGLNSLRIVRRVEGRLYYVVSNQVYLPQASIEASGRMQLSRRYFDADAGQPLAQFEAGQMVKVALEVNAPEDAYYVLVEDNLPGGLEALNEELNVSGHVVDEEGNERYLWEDLGYNNKEVYGDRVSFFITEMDKGKHVFSYFARATRSGTFTALPAEAWAMYDLDLWGRSSSDSVSVFP